MNFSRIMIAAMLFLIDPGLSSAAEDTKPPADTAKSPTEAPRPAHTPSQVVERAIQFLIQDTAKWRAERGCATCHHGTLSTWALTEARQKGFDVDPAVLADITTWTKDNFIPRVEKSRDSRPGWRLVSTPGIYLGMMSTNLPVLSRDEINLVALHLARHQEEDGAFEPPPPANGAPPIWESRETVALLALLAWEGRQPGNLEASTIANRSRDKLIEWLQKNPSTGTTQAATFRLLLDVRTSGKTKEQLQPDIEALLKRQSADGGWSQTADFPSDAYATGQALYVLAEVGVDVARPEIQRAISFLATTQQADGSWPMTSRNHPGVETTRKPIRNPIPITYFGAAWGTLGLVRVVPTPPDTLAKQQVAFDKIRGFHGKFERDEQQADKPVVHVDLRYYPIDDNEAADFAKVLTAFPKLATLEFKSPKFTDVALGSLTNLPQLRVLNLEETAVTDAGITHLNVFKQLQSLNLKGTPVTAAGAEAITKIFPTLKVER